MNSELKAMSRKELEKLLADVKKALSAAQARDRRDALKAAERAAAEYGFSLNDLGEEKPAKAKNEKAPKKPVKKSKPKYVNPADGSQTWTGKGRQPNWFRAEVEKGTDPSTLEI
ncbi:H-NS histone family protein [Sulfitobacter guttiformis]|uniref:DNA-binding protein H-NS n=1 Tax=Sulfitobacter guttiformis TaxID=74349 RepID=A0A420DU31_9RHOB|nr:H-NS histone family protein [Sulfitobacter guttiformis]KIN71384.1 Histone-like nucleoid-structuring protein H-NS [Sulfitobacter guttiformis KCTC 32187]RKE97831.1 DNA-binding protein H-NS [Sulfitobacter guttiformis]